MNICSLCHQLAFETFVCKSCDEDFCDECFDRHFLVGPHPQWYVEHGPSWPRKLTDGYMNDGRGIWIPAIEPDEWFTPEGKRI